MEVSSGLDMRTAERKKDYCRFCLIKFHRRFMIPIFSAETKRLEQQIRSVLMTIEVNQSKDIPELIQILILRLALSLDEPGRPVLQLHLHRVCPEDIDLLQLHAVLLREPEAPAFLALQCEPAGGGHRHSPGITGTSRLVPLGGKDCAHFPRCRGPGLLSHFPDIPTASTTAVDWHKNGSSTTAAQEKVNPSHGGHSYSPTTSTSIDSRRAASARG